MNYSFLITMKFIKKKKVRIRICPRCKKATLKTAVNVAGWLAPNIFECTSCDYIGALYIEIDPKDLELTQNSDNEDQ